MSKNELLPELPFEIRAARIGTCFDARTKSLKTGKIVIDPSKLNKGAITFVHGSGNLELAADSTTEKYATGTFLDLDAKVKIGSWVSLGYHMSLADESASDSDMLSCYCSYVYKGQSLLLGDYKGNSMFNYMTDEFQEAFKKLLKSSAKTYYKNYIKFQRKFGDGFITQLFLTSGSAFKITAKYSSSANSNTAKYGGSIAVGGFWGGVSTAADYAKTVQKADSEASMKIAAIQIPENTPTRDWCTALIEKVSSAGFEKLSKTPGLITSYVGNIPQAPEFPQGNPSKEKLPEKERADITEEVHKDQMKQDNFTGTWEEYLKAQEEAYKKLKPETVVNDVLENIDYLLSSNPDNRLQDLVDPLSDIDEPGSVGTDLEGYIPIGYVCKQWHELFPQLRSLEIKNTFSSIYIAESYVYYQTRLEFLSYLAFLSDLKPDGYEHPTIENDLNNYNALCTKLLNNINQKIKSTESFQKSDYNSIVSAFESEMNNITEFCSKKIYNVFFEHYSFFVENACGFILTWQMDDGQTVYQTGPEIYTKTPNPFSLIAMLKNAQKFYPVVYLNGSIKLAYISIRNWNFIPMTTNEAWNCRFKDNNGFYYYNLHNKGKPYRFYGAGFKELSKMKNSTIFGEPMLQDFDFDLILDYANPNF